jgi:PAS domain S-box-containing protein
MHLGEDLFRGLLEAAPDAIVGVTQDGVIALVNAQTEALFGYGRDELIGRRMEMLVPESVRGVHPGHRDRYFAAPTTRPMGAGMELAGRRKDGSEFPAEISLSTIETGDGLLVSAAIRDVTARKQAEAKFRRLLEAAPDAIVGVTQDGVIALVNAQTEALFGYERDELIGQRMEILVPESARAVHPGHRDGYFAAPVTRPMGAGMDLAGRRKDGSEFPAEISLSTIETEDGLLVSAAIRDGTERKHAAIVASSADAIVGKDANGRITSWNPGAEALYGYSPAQMLGHHVRELIPADLLAEEDELSARVFRGERLQEYETVRRRADGTTVPVAKTMSPIYDAAGDVVGISAIGRDITDRKRMQAERQALEDRLHQSERLESLGQLAGGIAHDFNNLLSVILNYAAFVLEEISDNEPVQDDIREIREAAERAARLTRQLLIFGRRETTQPEPLDLDQVVADVRNLLSRTLGEDIVLVVHMSDHPPVIHADRGQVEQVLVNLAVNARDAMPDGGTLTIETSPVTLDDNVAGLHPGLVAGRYIQLSVSDTGSGMAQATIDRAFEPFFTTKARGEGTGLGLATVYGIVTGADGGVTIYSELDIGTTIRVYFRPSSLAPVSHTTEPPKLGHADGETILVVEDEAAIRKVADRILTRYGYQVLLAANGVEAMQLIEEHDIDLVLTDVVMPQMSGRELVERLKVVRPGTPTLFVSGYSQGVLGPRQGLDEGVALLQKPFSEHSLIESVHDLLAHSRT